MTENQGGLTPDDVKRAFQTGSLGMPDDVVGAPDDDAKKFGAVGSGEIPSSTSIYLEAKKTNEPDTVGPLGMPEDIAGKPVDDTAMFGAAGPAVSGEGREERVEQQEEGGGVSPEASGSVPGSDDEPLPGEDNPSNSAPAESEENRQRREAEERREQELEAKRKAVEKSLKEKFREHQENIDKEIKDRGPLARFWQFYQRNPMARIVSGALTVGMAAIPGGRLVANSVRTMTAFLGGATAVDAHWMKKQESVLTADFADCKDKDGNWDARKIATKLKTLPKERKLEVLARLESISTAKGLKINSALLAKEQEDYKKYMEKRKGVMRGFDKLRDNFNKMPWWGKVGVSVGLGVLGLQAAGFGAAGLAVNGALQLGLGALRSTRETSKLAFEHSAIIEAVTRDLVRSGNEADPAARFDPDKDFARVADIQEKFKDERKKSALKGGGAGVATAFAMRVAFLMGKQLLGYEVDLGRDFVGVEKAHAATVDAGHDEAPKDVAPDAPRAGIASPADSETPVGIPIPDASAPGAVPVLEADDADILHLKDTTATVLNEPGPGAARRLAQVIVEEYQRQHPEAFPTRDHVFAAIRAEKENLMESGYFDYKNESLIPGTAADMPGHIHPQADMREVVAHLSKYMPDDEALAGEKTGGVESHHAHQPRTASAGVTHDDHQHDAAEIVPDVREVRAPEMPQVSSEIKFSENTDPDTLPPKQLDAYLKWLEANHPDSVPAPDGYGRGVALDKGSLGALIQGETGQHRKFLGDGVSGVIMRMAHDGRTSPDEIRIVADGGARHLIFPIHSTAPDHHVVKWDHYEINHESAARIDQVVHENSQHGLRGWWNSLFGPSRAKWFDDQVKQQGGGQLSTSEHSQTAVTETTPGPQTETPEMIEARVRVENDDVAGAAVPGTTAITAPEGDQPEQHNRPGRTWMETTVGSEEEAVAARPARVESYSLDASSGDQNNGHRIWRIDPAANAGDAKPDQNPVEASTVEHDASGVDGGAGPASAPAPASHDGSTTPPRLAEGDPPSHYTPEGQSAWRNVSEMIQSGKFSEKYAPEHNHGNWRIDYIMPDERGKQFVHVTDYSRTPDTSGSNHVKIPIEDVSSDQR